MNWVSYAVFWVLAPIVMSFFVKEPLVAGVALVAVVGYRWLPDPWQLLKGRRRLRWLRAQIEVNHADLTARRQLAAHYIAKGRPERAIPLLDVILAREPASADARQLLADAHFRQKDYAKAAVIYMDAVAISPKLHYGEPLLRAGDALRRLGRPEDAVAAYQRFNHVNSSSVEGWYKLALAQHERADGDAARLALDEAMRTFSVLPGFQRRRQVLWYVRARVRRMVGA